MVVGQPWDLSGPQFLGVYAAGFGITIIVPLVFWQVIRWAPGRWIPRELDPYEAGYLQGQEWRVAEVIVAELVDSDALRVDSTGKLREVDRTVRTGQHATSLDRAWPHGMPDGLTTHDICGKLRSDSCVEGIKRGLRADGLIFTRRQIALLVLLTAVLVAALAATGILRMIEGVSNHRPIGLLIILMIWSLPAEGVRYNLVCPRRRVCWLWRVWGMWRMRGMR